jgi:LmbE family N-acetylglucosaminyl deacetylase
MPVNWRQFIARSAIVTAPFFAAATAPPLAAAGSPAGRILKVVCVGAHPDDPESGCGRTLARYAELGHEVVVIYMTRGERGIRDTAADEAGRIRTREAEMACKLLKAKPVFFGLIDAATELTRTNVEGMT